MNKYIFILLEFEKSSGKIIISGIFGPSSRYHVYESKWHRKCVEL